MSPRGERFGHDFSPDSPDFPIPPCLTQCLIQETDIMVDNPIAFLVVPQHVIETKITKIIGANCTYALCV